MIFNNITPKIVVYFCRFSYLYGIKPCKLAEKGQRDLFCPIKFPFNPSDFIHFRNRVGKESIGKIFTYSVHLHGKEVPKQSKFVLSDTTVQENNTTFPTDAKLSKKVIDKCNKIAEETGIKQRQRYTRKSKRLVRDTYNGNHPKRAKKGGKAKRRLKTIADALLRKLERKMTDRQKACYQEQMEQNKLTLPQKLAYDCGGKGRKQIKGVTIITPDNPKASGYGLSKTTQTQQMQSQSSNRAHHRKSEKRLSYGTKLPLGRKRHTNQCLYGSNDLEPEENEGKTCQRVFVLYSQDNF